MSEDSISQPGLRPEPVPSRTALTLRVLGRRQLCTAGGEPALEVLAQPKRFAILLYLALATPRGPQRRDTLVSLFWPDADSSRARSSLRKALHELRHGLGEPVLVSIGSEEVVVDPRLLWCDAVAFTEAAADGRHEDALALYTGDLLPGFFARDAAGFERWLEQERARLRGIAIEQARRAAEQCERDGDIAAAIERGRRCMMLAELDESYLQWLMRLLDRAGNHAAVVATVEQFSRRLEREHGDRPSPETLALLDRIRRREGRVTASPAAPSPRLARQESARQPDIESRASAAAFPAAVAPVPSQVRRRSSALGWGIAAASLLVSLAAAWWTARPHEVSAEAKVPAASAGPRWVVLAEFTEPEGDPGIAMITQSVVASAVEHAGLVALVPSAEIRAARRAASIPDSVRLTPTVAREVALRSDADVVVGGLLDREGSDITLTVEAIRADSGTVITRGSARVPNPDALIMAADSLGRTIQRALGEEGGRRHSAAGRTTRLWPATPSYRAHQLWYEAQRKQFETGDHHSAMAPLREALRLDSTFVRAWMYLGVMYINQGMRDSADAAYARARRYVDTTDLRVRLLLDAYIAATGPDRAGELRAYDAYIRHFPWSPMAHANRSSALDRAQRYGEAVAAARRSISLERSYQIPVTRANLASALMSLGRFAEADSALTQGGVPPDVRFSVAIPLVLERWREADSIAQRQLDPARPPGVRRRAAVALASSLAARGRVEQAVSTLHEALRYPHGDESPPDARAPARALLLLAVVSGDSAILPRTSDVAGGGPGRALVRGLIAAARGDVVGARAERARLQRLAVSDSFAIGLGPSLIDAWLLRHEGRLADAAALAGPLLASRPWDENEEQVLLLARWLLADVAEQRGRLDTAVQLLERVIDPVEVWRNWEMELRGFAVPYAHRRLVVLYERMGQREAAERHRRALSSLAAASS